MKSIISSTGVSTLGTGDTLTASTINSINSGTNKAIEVCNYGLYNFCNINQELETYDTGYTLAEAIELVPSARRSQGLCIRFMNTNGIYVEYVYSSTSTSEWSNTSYWNVALDTVDGGTW